MPNRIPSEPPALADSGPVALDEAVLQRLQQELSAEMMPSVIVAFLAEIDERVSALVAASRIGDWRAASRHAHTIKGTAATLGANALAEIAGRIEAAGQTGDGTAVDGNIRPLQQQTRHLTERLGHRYSQTATF
jgi:two-component system sensor histidine kinase/response regulator